MRQEPGPVHASVTPRDPPRPTDLLEVGAKGAGSKASDNGSQRSARGPRNRGGRGSKESKQREGSGSQSLRHGAISGRHDLSQSSSQPSTSASAPSISLIQRSRLADPKTPAVSPSRESLSLPSLPQKATDMSFDQTQSGSSAEEGAPKARRDGSCKPIEDPPPSSTRLAGLIQLPLRTEAKGEEQSNARAANHRQPHAKSAASQGTSPKAGRSGSGRGAGSLSRYDRFDKASEPRSTATDGTQHQLFDPKRHNAVQFSKSVGTVTSSDARSSAAGSTSTTAPSTTTSMTSGDSRHRSRKGDAAATSQARGSGPDTSGYVNEIRRIYRNINNLETKLKHERAKIQEKRGCAIDHPDLVGATPGLLPNGAVDQQFWLQLREQCHELISLYETFLDRAMRPGLPSSLSSLPQDYDIPVRLWKNGVHPYVESIRHQLPDPGGSDSSQIMDASDSRVQTDLLDLLVDFIHFAYSFYANLLEADHLRPFRVIWLENLGDLARWRMAAAGIVATSTTALSAQDDELTNDGRVSATPAEEGDALPSSLLPLEVASSAKNADHPDRASIGKAALGDWDFDERDTWRTTAIDWYTQGLVEMPGQGKLHHSIGLLHRNDELRCFYHLCKSLTASDPHPAARETVSLLSLFSPEQQERRTRADATWLDLLLCLHGMLFHRVQLDDFEEIYSRMTSQLEVSLYSPDGPSMDSPTWMMVAGINIAALMQYGTEDALLAGSSAGRQATPAATGSYADRDAREKSHAGNSSVSTGLAALTFESTEPSGGVQPDGLVRSHQGGPLRSLQRAAILAFGLLELVLSSHKSISESTAPYATMVFTLLFRLAKDPPLNTDSTMPVQLGLLSPFLPWRAFAALSLPTHTLLNSNSPHHDKIKAGHPLPEDWCLRGLSWAGRKVFERDYWKSPSRRRGLPNSDLNDYTSEFDVLQRNIDGERHYGTESQIPVRDNDDGDSGNLSSWRWARVALSLRSLAHAVPGLTMTVEGAKAKVEIQPPLCDALKRWARREEGDVSDAAPMTYSFVTEGSHSPAAEDAKSNTEGDAEDADEWNESDYMAEEDDSAEVKELKARRMHLLRMLSAAQPGHGDGNGRPPQQRQALTAAEKTNKRDSSSTHPSSACKAVPGYTVLLLDTNILLAKDSYLPELVECKRWIVVIPLAVITELDGLKKNPPPLGEEAAKVLAYLDRALKTSGKWLKIQTSKGSYLNDLSFRSEEIDFAGGYSGGSERRTLKGPGNNNNNGSSSCSQHGSPNPSGPTSSATFAASPFSTLSASEPPFESETTFVVPLARSLDDVILRTYQWHSMHFVDRLSMLSASAEEAGKTRSEKIKSDTPKTVLVTLDRGMRLRVKATGGVAAGRAELKEILKLGLTGR